MANTPFPTSTPTSPTQPRSDTKSGSASIGTGSGTGIGTGSNDSITGGVTGAGTGTSAGTGTGIGSSGDNHSHSGNDLHDQRNATDEQVASAAQTAHKLVDRAAERLSPAMDNLKARADKASSAMHERIDQLDEVQQRWTDDSRSSIRSNPLTWVISALAVGMVLGRLRSGR